MKDKSLTSEKKKRLITLKADKFEAEAHRREQLMKIRGEYLNPDDLYIESIKAKLGLLE